MECLLAKMDANQENMDVKMDASQERMEAKINASQERLEAKTDSSREVDGYNESKSRKGRIMLEACLEKTEATGLEANPEEIQF
jgi:uncharacterized membrane protein